MQKDWIYILMLFAISFSQGTCLVVLDPPRHTTIQFLKSEVRTYKASPKVKAKFEVVLDETLKIRDVLVKQKWNEKPYVRLTHEEAFEFEPQARAHFEQAVLHKYQEMVANKTEQQGEGLKDTGKRPEVSCKISSTTAHPTHVANVEIIFGKYLKIKNIALVEKEPRDYSLLFPYVGYSPTKRFIYALPASSVSMAYFLKIVKKEIGIE